MLDQAHDRLRLVRRIDRLHREADMIADDLRRRARHPGHLGAHAFPGLVGAPDEAAQPGQPRFDRTTFSPGNLANTPSRDQALQLVLERGGLRDVVLDVVGRPARRAVGA